MKRKDYIIHSIISLRQAGHGSSKTSGHQVSAIILTLRLDNIIRCLNSDLHKNILRFVVKCFILFLWYTKEDMYRLYAFVPHRTSRQGSLQKENISQWHLVHLYKSPNRDEYVKVQPYLGGLCLKNRKIFHAPCATCHWYKEVTWNANILW